jgi:hypothetical protein
MKLRKGSRYFVADPNDVEFGKRIPLVCRYRGRVPEGHDFEIVGNPDSGYWLSDEQVTLLVEPFSKKRAAEIDVEAGKYLAGEFDRR